MPGRTRKNIFPGLRVAIVLKEDQPTGKRTIGEVANILTSDSTHHRGIKVRLKDGRVGRVQEILPAAAPQTSAPLGVPQLVVLVLYREEGGEPHYYVRELKNEFDEVLITLGIDASGNSQTSLEGMLKKLLGQISSDQKSPQPLFSKKVEVQEQQVLLHAYLIQASNVQDPDAHLWSKVGWRARSSVNNLQEGEFLSEESEKIWNSLVTQG